MSADGADTDVSVHYVRITGFSEGVYLAKSVFQSRTSPGLLVHLDHLAER